MRPELFTIPGINVTIPSFGAMVMIGFLGALWWMTRRAAKAKQDPDLVLNIGFISLVFMAVGARSFYVIHYWETQFKHQPWQIFSLSSGGIEFYGGLIGAFVPSLLYTLYKRLSVRLWTDMVAPSLLFGMGVGRIGCYLAGCCFGAPCPAHLPWAVHFPYSSNPQMVDWEHRLSPLPAELILQLPGGDALPIPYQVLKTDPKKIDANLQAAAEKLAKAKQSGDAAKIASAELTVRRAELAILPFKEHMTDLPISRETLAGLSQDPDFRSQALHPAQLYSAVGPLLLAWLTNAYFYRRKRHGTVFVLALVLYAVERFIEESIRLDNPVDTLGLTVSQAISVGVIVAMGLWYLVLRQLPLRSPRAVPFVPADKKAAKPQAAPA